jgi:hypothetical protein
MCRLGRERPVAAAARRMAGHEDRESHEDGGSGAPQLAHHTLASGSSWTAETTGP